MPIYSLALHMQKAPPIVKRNRHVLVLLQDLSDRFVLGKKKIYPKGIVRMVGGGAEKFEPFFKAATREVYEELHYYVGRKDLAELAQIFARITDDDGQVFNFRTAIYFAKLERKPLFPSDDLDGIARLTEPEYLHLIQQYKRLPKEIDPAFNFSWYDYGQLYSYIHQVAWEELQTLKSQKLNFV